MDKKRQVEKKLYDDQINDMLYRKKNKKINFEKEKENGLNFVKEFEKIMEKLDNERNNYSSSIRNKANIQDLRQSLMKNVKDSENEIKREMEMKYRKDKEEIEKR